MDAAEFVRLPKALLHDHLDGGLRPRTVLELADEIGYDRLPTMDEAKLAAWFHQGAAGSLVVYLKAFQHTVGVLQTPEALDRAAYECGIDLAADGVVYAEVRFAPSLHRILGMDRRAAIEAVLSGLDRACRETGLVAGVIVTAMRNETDSLDVARAAAPFAGSGVVGFDLAGPEDGYPADDHAAAFRVAREAGLALTIHAGEHGGPESIWRAAARCGAQRIGHGAGIIADCIVAGHHIDAVGDFARTVLDQRIPLEICITSNIHTGLASSAADHPVHALVEAGFALTLNTDNRLMSATTASREMQLAHDEAGLSISQLGTITESAIIFGFGEWEARRRLIADVVRPAYAKAASG